ncbi:MAG: thioredoxin family protein [Clostridium sp.]|nr:thioredoxin family protein [Bacteroides sp.]MCM1198437.1 thioredoxin family protein [Clostridium sp.]
MKRFFTLVVTLLLCAAGFAQDETIRWKTEVRHVEDARYSIVFTGKIGSGYHTYGVDNPDSPTDIEFEEPDGYRLEGGIYELSKPSEFEGMKVFFNEIKIAQDITLLQDNAVINGEINWLSCTETSCISPEYHKFSISAAEGIQTGAATSETSDKQTVIAEASEESGNGFNWALIIEAIIWGFAALLTPCVFPMVPMTVSFFMKGSSSAAAGRFKASMYGLFIVLLYTVPISIIILITRIVGGDAVTADIFNWLATHWLPNLIFFIVFMIFAASFFGAFEIVLPSKLINRSDKGADKGGLLGIFFMSLTLVLVSFSCTGPIVGSVLIKATQGQFWEPMIAMLAFSMAFALPFTLLAFFPSLLKNLPKSGGWLNSVKVVLGFVEVALGFKFLSVADQTYHWGLLDREVYLAIWITVFTLLGLYLLGKIRFANDDKTEHVSVKRLALAIAVFSFVVYMVPGMFGAPLKALSGYLPPISTQDFVLGSNTAAQGVQPEKPRSRYDLQLPHGLQGYFSLEEGLEAAKIAGKPVFVDITGHGCVNCREMEARVWSDPQVLDILRSKYIIVALYTDDKQKLDKGDWVTTESGDVLKTLGRANSYIVRTRFGVNAQPNYVLLSPDGKQLAPVRGYNLNVQEFVDFLNIPFAK